MDARQEFLIEMYRQLFSDINRHIMVVWQSVGVVVSAFAIFALVEKQIMPLDVAAALVVVLTGWLHAHLIDASYWYNRNLVMIANIERQFLKAGDLKEIHYYFGAHRPKNRMITHLKIQVFLGLLLGALILLFHFVDRVLPGFGQPLAAFEPQRSLPYVITVLALAYVMHVKKHRDDSYAEFLENSPGAAVETKGIVFGKGHGHSPGAAG